MMMRFSRWLSIFTICLLSLLMLTGCEPKRYEVIHFYENATKRDVYDACVKALVNNDFNEYDKAKDYEIGIIRFGRYFSSLYYRGSMFFDESPEGITLTIKVKQSNPNHINLSANPESVFRDLIYDISAFLQMEPVIIDTTI